MGTINKITSPEELFAAVEKECCDIPSDYEVKVTLQDFGEKMACGNERVYIDITPAGNKYCDVVSIELILHSEDEYFLEKKVSFAVSCTRSGQGEINVLNGCFVNTYEELSHFVNTLLHYLASVRPIIFNPGFIKQIIRHGLHHNEWDIEIFDKTPTAMQMVISHALSILRRNGTHVVTRRMKNDNKCDTQPVSEWDALIAHTFREGGNGRGHLVTVWSDRRGRARVKTQGTDYEINRTHAYDIYHAVFQLAEKELSELITGDPLSLLKPIETVNHHQQWEFLPEWARFNYGWEHLTTEKAVDMPKLLESLQSKRNYVGRANDMKTVTAHSDNYTNSSEWYSEYVVEVKSHLTINHLTPTMVVHVKTEQPSHYRDMVLIEVSVHYDKDYFPDVENVISIWVPHNVLNIYRVLHELILVFNNCVKRNADGNPHIAALAHSMAREAYMKTQKVSPAAQARITNRAHLVNVMLSEIYQLLNKEPEIQLNIAEKAIVPSNDVTVCISSRNNDGTLTIAGGAVPKILIQLGYNILTLKETPTRGEITEFIDELVALLKETPLGSQQDD